MKYTRKIVAAGLSAAMVATMCVAVPATAVAADAAAPADATATAALQDINEVITLKGVADQFYSGSAITPLNSIAKKNNTTGDKMVAGTQYKVEYTNNVEIGTATAVLTGIESAGFTGTMTFTFNIIKFSFEITYDGKSLGSLDQAAIDKLKANSTDNNKDLYYQYGTTVVYVPAKDYITFNSLMKSADIATWTSVSATATDKFGSTVTSTVNAEGKFYPAQTTTSNPTDGAYNVPAIVASSYSTAEISSTAQQAADEAKAAYAEKKVSDNRLLMGALEADYVANDIAGKRFASSVCRFDIQGEYTALKANPLTVKLAKKTVKAGNKVKLTVKKAQGKVTYKTSNKNIKVKNGYVVVGKKVKAGKYTITVKAAGNDAYKADAKSVKITVK